MWLNKGDLGSWKFYRISKAILGLSALEQKDKREEGAALNINKARRIAFSSSFAQDMSR